MGNDGSLTEREQLTDSTLVKTYDLVVNLRLLNVRLIETADGLACEPMTLVDAGDRAWLRTHATLALAAQGAINESAAVAARNALSLHAALSALKTNPEMESDMRRLVQAEAVRLAGEIGWAYALALSGLVATVTPTPPAMAPVEATGPAVLHTGLYL